MPLNVFAIGSCRIHRPLRHLDDCGAVKLLNRIDPCWFVHTSGAARQYLDVVSGRARIPVELEPYILEGKPRKMNYDGVDQLAQCDLVVVEISSLKVHRSRGWDLNAHIIWRARKEADSSPVVKEMIDRAATEDEIIADLLYIREMTKRPVMVVDHLHFLDKDGNTFPARTQISGILANAETKLRFPFFSTRPTIDLHGIGTALEDHAHYRKEFEAVVGAAMHPFLLRSADSMLQAG